MDSECAAASIGEDVEITASLRGLYDAERVLLAGHGKVGGVIVGDLEKDAGVRAAFVGLSCGMQESRAEAEAGGEFLFVTNDVTEFLKNFFVFGVHGDIAENGKVIAGSRAGEVFFQNIHQL